MEHTTSSHRQPLDLSPWRKVPVLMMCGGGVLALLGLAFFPKHFGYAWLQNFMFFVSLVLGALFLVLVHHLFDAGWSVPIRRFCEHIANLAPWLILLFVPIALQAKGLYRWMSITASAAAAGQPVHDEAIRAKMPLFTIPGFYITSAACFLVWWLLANRLRFWSLWQDRTGEAKATYRMRVYSCVGIFLFAITLTLGAIMWMKALQYQWFSTMYGVYYFAGSVWTTLATVYVITMILDRQGVLTETLHEHQYYFIGSLLFAFTVFYAYIHFAQYFIIWNGNLPEETFWYKVREQGTWWYVGMVIIFGHFFLPFLALLRIDVKHVFKIMTPLCAWAWLMHWIDLSFNIMPVPHADGFAFSLVWIDIGIFAFMGGLMTLLFLREYAKYPPYPLKDPRLVEAMGLFHPVPTQISGGEVGEAYDLQEVPPQFKGEGIK